MKSTKIIKSSVASLLLATMGANFAVPGVTTFASKGSYANKADEEKKPKKEHSICKSYSQNDVIEKFEDGETSSDSVTIDLNELAEVQTTPNNQPSIVNPSLNFKNKKDMESSEKKQPQQVKHLIVPTTDIKNMSHIKSTDIRSQSLITPIDIQSIPTISTYFIKHKSVQVDKINTLDELLGALKASSNSYNDSLNLISTCVKRIARIEGNNLIDVLYHFFKKGIAPFGETNDYSLCIIADCLSNFFGWSQANAFIDHLIDNHKTDLFNAYLLNSYKRPDYKYRSKTIKIRKDKLAEYFKEYFANK